MDIVDISSDSNTKTTNTLSEYIHQKYTDKKLKTMKILNITGQKFSSILGITQCQQITTLNLQNNAISDINALKNLHQIINLDLSSNQIINIWPLIYLHELQQVNLESNKVQDLLAFFGNKKLVSLNLNYNDVINLDPLQDCEQLEDLSLMENNIIDFYVLCDMKKLDSVELDGNMLIGAASYVREYESENEDGEDEEEDEGEYNYGRKYDEYDDGKVGKFYFGHQNFASKANQRFNDRLSKVTYSCIEQLKHYYKIHHMKKQYNKKITLAKSKIANELCSALNSLNHIVTRFTEAMSLSNTFE
ncbi:leucine-rich_repeat domain-containing protein [Hexamita inflata]|uniref:Leucine-rich repeat domain-containing protein n=1 Tax=Hexamita inflata TaxID=28002 RepID=A0AA86R5A6_9EUKA|nr:leucine-rich repeat domain-containing protein [Hexamita inflata]